MTPGSYRDGYLQGFTKEAGLISKDMQKSMFIELMQDKYIKDAVNSGEGTARDVDMEDVVRMVNERMKGRHVRTRRAAANEFRDNVVNYMKSVPRKANRGKKGAFSPKVRRSPNNFELSSTPKGWMQQSRLRDRQRHVKEQAFNTEANWEYSARKSAWNKLTKAEKATGLHREPFDRQYKPLSGISPLHKDPASQWSGPLYGGYPTKAVKDVQPSTAKPLTKVISAPANPAPSRSALPKGLGFDAPASKTVGFRYKNQALLAAGAVGLAGLGGYLYNRHNNSKFTKEASDKKGVFKVRKMPSGTEVPYGMDGIPNKHNELKRSGAALDASSEVLHNARLDTRKAFGSKGPRPKRPDLASDSLPNEYLPKKGTNPEFRTTPRNPKKPSTKKVVKATKKVVKTPPNPVATPSRLPAPSGMGSGAAPSKKLKTATKGFKYKKQALIGAGAVGLAGLGGYLYSRQNGKQRKTASDTSRHSVAQILLENNTRKLT